MIYLDKTNQDAINHVANFINGNWLEQNDGTFKYQNIDFDDVKNPAKTFKAFFINEQDNKCCYCCRYIVNDSNTELEHIIPYEKEDSAEFQPYYTLSAILRNNVVPQNLFMAEVVKQNLPPFPHRIAYHNIVASCNGRAFESSEDFTCCNRKRGHEFIPPFNLIQNSVGYIEDGTIVYLQEITNREYFEILNLNKDILKKIRRLWYLFTQSTLTLQDILGNTIELKEKITLHAIGNSLTPIVDLKLLETFSNPNTWDIFIKYYFFFNYYRYNNLPI